MIVYLGEIPSGENPDPVRVMRWQNNPTSGLNIRISPANAIEFNRRSSTAKLSSGEK